MRWVYILQCQEDYFYVGETSRLYRRFWEHQDGLGGLNTSTFIPEKIVAIYKVDTIGKFFDYNEYVNKIINGIWHENYNCLKMKDFNEYDEDQYDNLEAENNITECLMMHNKETWDKIRGGKYTRFDVKYRFPTNNYIYNLPLCKCNLPCDIRKNEEHNYLYFRCPKKNMWDKFKEDFEIDEDPCNFFMEYTKDKQLRLNENKQFENRKKNIKELFKKSFWLKHLPESDDINPEICIGGCKKYSYNKISYNYINRNLCYDCFIDKNEELAKKYKNKLFGECLIKL